MKSTWKAEISSHFESLSIENTKKLLGARTKSVDDTYIAPEHEEELTEFSILDEDIPDAFDVRQAWPQCVNITGILVFYSFYNDVLRPLYSV